MKKMFFVWTLIASLLAISCTKETSTYNEGPLVGEIYVTAYAGVVSVFVETTGQWRVNTEADWLTLDVEGGLGRGAFTASYSSNESDILAVKSSRKAVVVISSDETQTEYSFAIVQQGFYGEHELEGVQPDQEMTIEFALPDFVKKSFVLCSRDGIEGTDEKFETWLKSFDAAVVGEEVIGALPGVEIKGADFLSLTPDQEYAAFENLVETTYNSDNKSHYDWIIAGQFYHLSMMQAGYPSAPDWYPSNGRVDVFDADRYAWKNNLYDCLWLSERDYVITYTGQSPYSEESAGSWQADYVYLSKGLLAKVYSVEILEKPVESMEHAPICVTFNF